MPESIDLNFLVGIGGLIVGLIGVVLAVLFHYKNKNHTALEYQIDSINLITKEMTNIPNLQVHVGNEPVSEMVSTTVRFTNTGNRNISSMDFASKSPLQIVSTKRFLNANDINISYIKTNNINLNPSIEIIDNNTLLLGFEYLRPKQMFSITLLHEGNISVSGDLKIGKMFHYKPPQLTKRQKHFFNLHTRVLAKLYPFYMFYLTFISIFLIVYLFLEISPIVINWINASFS